MKALRSITLLGATLMLAAPASGQVQMKLTQPYVSPPAGRGPTTWNYGNGGVYIGPYQGMMLSRPGTPTIDIYCVDYLNSIRVNQTWNANFFVLSGNLGATRFGGLLNATQLYQKAAYLTTLFAMQTTSAGYAGIHAAIWHLFTPNNPAWTSSTAALAQPWLAMANANYQSINLNEWSVVTDVNTQNGVGGVQEYLTHNVVPEPATILLMGTGLLAVVGAGLVGRRLV